MEFWRATPTELFDALDGWREANGSTDEPEAEPVTEDELFDLMERFPDG